MEYKVLSRPKLPRNKYGEVDDKNSVGGGNSYFTSPTNANGGEAGSSSDLQVFVGSTNTLDGKKGLVPAPKTNNDEPLITNDNQKFLKGSGAWVDIPISRYTTENTNKDGINLTGNLSVSDTLTTQTLNVLGVAHFWELVVDKVKAAGGNLLITPANFIVDFVGADVVYNVDETQSPFTVLFYSQSGGTGVNGLKELFTANNIASLKAKRLYMINSDSNSQIASEFVIGDMVRCKTLNLDAASGFSNKDYWTFVLATGTATYQSKSCMYIDVFYQYTDSNSNTYGLGTVATDAGGTLPEFKFGYGTFSPAVGDNIVSLGHLWDGDRQSAILISSYDPMDTELTAPALSQYQGINKFSSLSPFRTTSIAANGNNFEGSFKVFYDGNYVDINERINIFNADLTTGLEKVGIHLDGDNSTIKLIGSVEIKQNSDGIPDTLTVWDDDNIMRIKVSPEAIPNKSQIQTNINPTSNMSFNTITGQNRPTGGTTSESASKSWNSIFSYTWVYTYTLNNGYYSYITTTSIGTFSAGDKITVSNLVADIRSRAYFRGQDYTSTRSAYNQSQSISSIILRLRRLVSGTTYTTVDTYTLTDTATKTVAAESANINYPNTIINNYQIPTSGTYILELEVVYNVYASIVYRGERKSNPYFMFDNSFISSVDIIQPSASMTRIGSNGLVFNTDNAGEYFYAGNDGIEIKWGDSAICLDDTSGLKLTCGITNITNASSKYIPASATLVNTTTIDTDTTVYLPSASSYGVGREITIICNDYITLSTYRNSEFMYRAMGTEESYGNYPSAKTNPFSSLNTISCSSVYDTQVPDGDGGTQTLHHRSHNPLIRLLCNGSGWYII